MSIDVELNDIVAKTSLCSSFVFLISNIFDFIKTHEITAGLNG
jgi:hypothetical protein